MTDCPNCGAELKQVEEDHLECPDCGDDYHYFDYYVDDGECPSCGKDLSTDFVENDRLIVGHFCEAEGQQVEVLINNA